MATRKLVYCKKCEKVVEKPIKCGHNFEFSRNNTKDHVNMRTTWSNTTKVEFSQTTIDKDIKERNSKI